MVHKHQKKMCISIKCSPNNKRWVLTLPTLLNVYSALVRSLFEYASVFVFVSISETTKEQLRTIQNAALRIILHVPFNYTTRKNISNHELLELSKIKSVDERMQELA